MIDAVTYDEHKTFLNRQVDGALAEYAGFASAKFFDKCMSNYSTNPHIQARYELGFRDGKAMLLLEKEAG